MSKFSLANYTADAIARLVKKLHIADEYPYQILGDYAGLSSSMMRQIADGNREMKSQYFVMMVYNLLNRDGNSRALHIVLPEGYSITKNNDVKTNGSPEDEVIDGGAALYTFRDGFHTSNVEVMDRAIEQTEEVLERMKGERARKAGRKP